MAGKGTAVAAGTAGIILVWSGVQNRTVLSVIRNIIAGQPPKPGPGTVTADSGGVTASGQVVNAGRDTQNQQLGKLLAGAYGWSSGPEWTALNNIVEAESGWNDEAQNPDSSAAGIAQNINGYGPGYRQGDATSQINWMLNYIKQRYGDPIAAWNFHVANGWY